MIHHLCTAIAVWRAYDFTQRRPLTAPYSPNHHNPPRHEKSTTASLVSCPSLDEPASGDLYGVGSRSYNTQVQPQVQPRCNDLTLLRCLFAEHGRPDNSRRYRPATACLRPALAKRTRARADAPKPAAGFRVALVGLFNMFLLLQKSKDNQRA